MAIGDSKAFVPGGGSLLTVGEVAAAMRVSNMTVYRLIKAGELAAVRVGHNYRIRDIANIVAEVVPGCRLEIAPDASPDTRSYRVNFDKIARVLPAFKPQFDARRGAEQLYAAYRKSSLTLDEFEGPRYQRISHIQKLIADGVLADDLRHCRTVERRLERDVAIAND